LIFAITAHDMCRGGLLADNGEAYYIYSLKHPSVAIGGHTDTIVFRTYAVGLFFGVASTITQP